MSLPDLQNEDFLEQMLCALQSAGASWPEISSGTGAGGAVGQSKSTLPWDVDLCDDQSVFLTTKLRQHQISSGDGGAHLQQQLMLSTAGDTAVFRNELADNSTFKSPTGDNTIQGVFNGFAGSTTLQSNQTQNFQYPPAQTFRPSGPAAPSINQGPAAIAATASGGGGGPPAQPRQRVRARRGQATDPHSIAERLRRERIAERMKSLQELVPNANKTDKASMLDEIIDYVKFLQLQVKVLSMSRMGGVAAVAPLVADISSEGGRDGAQGAVGGGAGRNNTTTPSSSTNDTLMTVAENQVVKLMEEDMGSAMQYLQGKGLCLMPISLATAISNSTANCHLRTARNNHPTLGGSDGGATSCLNLSVTSGQSANGVLLPELVSVKDSTSVSKS